MMTRLRPMLGKVFGEDDGKVKEASERIDFVETFCGCQSITRGLRLFGFVGMGVDVNFGQDYDVLDPVGLRA